MNVAPSCVGDGLSGPKRVPFRVTEKNTIDQSSALKELTLEWGKTDDKTSRKLTRRASRGGHCRAQSCGTVTGDCSAAVSEAAPGELSTLAEEKRKPVCQEQSRCREGRASEELGLTLHVIGRQGEASEQEGDGI